MHSGFVCWKCGASLKGLSTPLSRRDECPACHTELHVCRMCRHFDSSLIGQCRHDHADPPRERERANFCDYFKMQPNAYQIPNKTASDSARDQLAELFTDGSINSVTSNEGDAMDEAREAKLKLEQLFGLQNDSENDNE